MMIKAIIIKIIVLFRVQLKKIIIAVVKNLLHQNLKYIVILVLIIMNRI